MPAFEPPLKKRKLNAVQSFSELVYALKQLKRLSDNSENSDESSQLTDQQKEFWSQNLDLILKYLHNFDNLSPLVELASLDLKDSETAEILDLFFCVDENIASVILKKCSISFANPVAEMIFYAECNMGNIQTKSNSVLHILKFLRSILKDHRFKELVQAVSYGDMGFSAVQFSVDRQLLAIAEFFIASQIAHQCKFLVDQSERYTSFLEYLFRTNNVDVLKLLPAKNPLTLTLDEEVAYLGFKARNSRAPIIPALIHSLTFREVEEEILRRCLSGDIQDFLDVFGHNLYGVTVSTWKPKVYMLRSKTVHPIFDELEAVLNDPRIEQLKELFLKVKFHDDDEEESAEYRNLKSFLEGLKQSRPMNLNFFIDVGKTTIINFLADCGDNYQSVRHIFLELINLGINVNLGDYQGATPLYYLATNYKTEEIEALLANGAEPNYCAHVGNENTNRIDLTTPLQSFFDNDAGHQNFELLIAGGANVHIVDDYGRTLLFNANRDEATRLIDMGVDVDKRDEDGETALHDACKRKNVEFVDRLLKEPNLDLRARNSIGSEALQCAAQGGNTEIINKLLETGVYNVHHVNEKGFNALYYAFVSGKIEAVRIFTGLGLDPSFLRDKSGKIESYFNTNGRGALRPELERYLTIYEKVSSQLFYCTHFLPTKLRPYVEAELEMAKTNLHNPTTENPITNARHYSKVAIAYLLKHYPKIGNPSAQSL